MTMFDITVEWSCCEDFSSLEGEHCVEDPLCHAYYITDLTSGKPYFVRVRAWNIKGYSDSAVSSPASAVPSSWREIETTLPRSHGKLQLLNDLFVNMKNSRPADASEIKGTHRMIILKKHGLKLFLLFLFKIDNV